jgi:hypothetical protein
MKAELWGGIKPRERNDHGDKAAWHNLERKRLIAVSQG